jgi:hypothetical protein
VCRERERGLKISRGFHSSLSSDQRLVARLGKELQEWRGRKIPDAHPVLGIAY